MVPPDATLNDFDVNDMLTLSANATGANRVIIIITASTSLMISHTTCPGGDGECFLSGTSAILWRESVEYSFTPFRSSVRGYVCLLL